MANTNNNLHQAKRDKNDEFYTTYEEIQKELNHYEDKFEGKTVLCNCDDPFESNFCKFFLRNFNYLKLKRLICTSYNSSPFAGTERDLWHQDVEIEDRHGFLLDVSAVPMANGRGVSDKDIDTLLHSGNCVHDLQGDGDFRSEECIEYLKQADIVVTNPPFSLFKEYVAQLMEYGKKFLIIGSQNAITYRDIFTYIKNNELWLGYKFGDMSFRVPTYYEARETRFWIDEEGNHWRSLGNACWYTNLDHQKRHEKIILYKRYNEDNYPKYDNYDAINVARVAEIPQDYNEVMGVPITFLDKYCPEQFEIFGMSASAGYNKDIVGIDFLGDKDARPLINGKNTYARLFIKKRALEHD